MNNSLNFYIEVEEGADRDAIAEEMTKRMLHLQEIEAAEAIPDNSRLTGVEIIAGIAVTVAVIKGTGEVVDELNRLMPKIRQLILEFKDVKKVLVELGPESIDIETVDEVVNERIASDMEG